MVPIFNKDHIVNIIRHCLMVPNGVLSHLHCQSTNPKPTNHDLLLAKPCPTPKPCLAPQKQNPSDSTKATCSLDKRLDVDQNNFINLHQQTLRPVNEFSDYLAKYGDPQKSFHDPFLGSHIGPLTLQ